MSRKGAARDIDGEAAAWALRIDGHDHPPAELTAWLAEDPRREGALLRAQAALNLVDRAAAVYGAGSPAPAVRPSRPSRRSLMAAGGGAIAAGIAGGIGLWSLQPELFDTRKGEIRRVPLHDGSLVAINTDSSVAVSLSRRRRTIDLRRGEAWFEVAKDPARPFVVAAGEVRVRAVGTAFSVRRHLGAADVMVTEGVVEVWAQGHEAQAVKVPAGSRIVLDPARAGAPAAAAQDIEGRLAWRSGQIVLDGQSLAEAAAEFNRYNERRIVIDDAALAAQRFVGVFQLNEPESFVRAVGASTGARFVDQGGVLHLKTRS